MGTATDTPTKAKRGRGRPPKSTPTVQVPPPAVQEQGVPDRLWEMIVEIESIVPILRDRGENWHVGSLESVKARLKIIMSAVQSNVDYFSGDSMDGKA